MATIMKNKTLLRYCNSYDKVIQRFILRSAPNAARPVKVPPPVMESSFPFYDPWLEQSPRGPHPRTKAGSKITLNMIPGVGIGKEMLDATMEVFKCIGAPITAEWIPETGQQSLDLMKLAVRRNGVAIKGNIEERSTIDIVNADDESLNFLLLESLDLFANVTYLKGFKSLEARDPRRFKYVDVIVIRSNTEGEFSLLEHQPHPGTYEHLRVISSYNTRRVSEFAFQLAKKENRKVTVLHQKHTMPLSEGAFLEEFLEVAKNHKDIEHEVLNYHNASALLMQKNCMGVILSNSVYCSQLVDFMIGMIGGPALVASGSYSNRYVVFEPSVSSRSRRLVGKNEANPTPYLLCGAHALDYLGLRQQCCVIRDAIECAFGQGVMTKDIGGQATTQQFIKQVIKHVQAVVPQVMCKYDKNPQLNVKMPTEWAPEKSYFFFQNKDTGKCPRE